MEIETTDTTEAKTIVTVQSVPAFTTEMILTNRLEILNRKLRYASIDEEKRMLRTAIEETQKSLNDAYKKKIQTGETECIVFKDGKKSLKKIETHYFDCSCSLSEHTLRFAYDPEYNELYSEIHLTKDRFFTRLWHAIRHVFGYQCRYGSFGCWTMDNDDTDRLITLLNRKKNNESGQNSTTATKQ